MATIKIIQDLDEACSELKKIGCYESSISIMAPKLLFKAIKLKDIPIRQALIIKQEALSIGSEAAVSKETSDLTAEKTDILISGTVKNLLRLIEKLKAQPYGLKQTALELEQALTKKTVTLKVGKKKYLFDGKSRPLMMGILNITPDSFSDGGKYLDVDAAIAHALEMERLGADIIDVGAESTRPGSDSISAEEEIKRIIPVLKKLKGRLKVPISIDTYKSKVAIECIPYGIDMINDISGLSDPKLADIAAKYHKALIIMHIKGMPKNMQNDIDYKDIIDEIDRFFEEKIALARSRGVKNIIIDPGIGFAKELDHNLIILRKLSELKRHDCPILVGPSRKSFIGRLSGAEPRDRLSGTIASIAIAIENGADIVRVHDIAECRQALLITNAIKNSR